MGNACESGDAVGSLGKIFKNLLSVPVIDKLASGAH